VSSLASAAAPARSSPIVVPLLPPGIAPSTSLRSNNAGGRDRRWSNRRPAPRRSRRPGRASSAFGIAAVITVGVTAVITAVLTAAITAANTAVVAAGVTAGIVTGIVAPIFELTFYRTRVRLTRPEQVDQPPRTVCWRGAGGRCLEPVAA
jgi:hypothetical protein